MSYAQDHLVCSSWHRAPEGWLGWTRRGNRPWCDLVAGHPGNHEARIFRSGETTVMVWPNKHKQMPEWLVRTTIHGLTMLVLREGAGDVANACELIQQVLRGRQEQGNA